MRNINSLYSAKERIDVLRFDEMTAPRLYEIISIEDVDYIEDMVRSLRYSARLKYKQNEIDRIMNIYGFHKISGGTNRVVYRNTEKYPDIVLKISTCTLACGDAPREYQNQKILKPFVTKCYEYSKQGAIGLYEYCTPVRDRGEFISIGGYVYDMLQEIIKDGYFVEDAGTNKFLNYCIRSNFGPVLCDYPYLYKLNKSDLFCDLKDDRGLNCGGLIAIDSGHNFLYCSKCGKRHIASKYGIMVGSTEFSLKGERLPYVGDEALNSTATLIKIMNGVETFVNKKNLPESRSRKSIINNKKGFN